MADTKKHRSAVECTYRPTNLRRWGQWNKHRSTGATHQVFSRTGKSKLISDILFLCVFIWLSAWQQDRSLHRVPLTNWCSEKLCTSSYNRTATPGENQEKIIIYIYECICVYIFLHLRNYDRKELHSSIKDLDVLLGSKKLPAKCAPRQMKPHSSWFLTRLTLSTLSIPFTASVKSGQRRNATTGGERKKISYCQKPQWCLAQQSPSKYYTWMLMWPEALFRLQHWSVDRKN